MFRVFIDKNAWNTFIFESQKYVYKETGGILIGYRVGNEFIITDCTGPGPNSRHKLYNFERDVKFCNEVLLSTFKESNGKHYYMGEWHTHPFGKPLPSSQDSKTMFKIAKNKGYQSENPILIIVRDKKETLSIGVFVYSDNEYTEAEYILF